MANSGGGSAFPYVVPKTAARFSEAISGMTLRDWFAGQIAGGIARGVTANQTETAAVDCYRFADALLAVREKGQQD